MSVLLQDFLHHSLNRTLVRRGQTLIGLMVVVAIMLVLGAAMYGRRVTNPDGTEGKTVLRASIDRSQEVALQSNLGQIQQIITMYKNDNEGKAPASFDELKKYAKFPNEMWINPVDQQPLDYNPATGTMIVKPYEGMSPSIQKFIATQPQRSGDAPPQPSTPDTSTPDSSGAPAMPKMPDIPTSPSLPDDSQ